MDWHLTCSLSRFVSLLSSFGYVIYIHSSSSSSRRTEMRRQRPPSLSAGIVAPSLTPRRTRIWVSCRPTRTCHLAEQASLKPAPPFDSSSKHRAEIVSCFTVADRRPNRTLPPLNLSRDICESVWTLAEEAPLICLAIRPSMTDFGIRWNSVWPPELLNSKLTANPARAVAATSAIPDSWRPHRPTNIWNWVDKSIWAVWKRPVMLEPWLKASERPTAVCVVASGDWNWTDVCWVYETPVWHVTLPPIVNGIILALPSIHRLALTGPSVHRTAWIISVASVPNSRAPNRNSSTTKRPSPAAAHPSSPVPLQEIVPTPNRPFSIFRLFRSVTQNHLFSFLVEMDNMKLDQVTDKT